jgi:hypothetical protein
LKTDELIQRLAAETAQVKPLLSPARRALLWSVAAGVSVVLGVLHFGVRRDIVEASQSLLFLLRVGLLAATMWLAVLAAFRLSVPGHDERAWSRWWPLALLGIVVALVAAEVVIGALGEGVGRGLYGWGCLRKVAFTGAVPAVLAVVLIVRASAVEPRWAALLGVLAAGAAGALTPEIACPIDGSLHILLWHVMPVTLAAGLGAIVGLFLWNGGLRRLFGKR